MTGLEFAEQAKDYLGWGYVYGEKLGRVLTKDIINALVKQNKRKNYYFSNCTVEKWLGTRCIDCSGLVCYILNKNGLMTQTEQLNTSASKLYYTYCIPVTKENLKVGDLVFRKSPTDIPHVGIYVGNGQTIEAKATSKGVVYGNVKDFNLFGRLKLLKDLPIEQKETNENINEFTGYTKIRMFDSDVHVYQTNKDEDVDVTLGQRGKLELLSKINDINKVIVAKINGGFFNPNGSREHLGTFVDEGKYYTSNNPTFIDFIYYKDGHTEIKFLKDLKEVAYVQGNSKWTIGTSWSLVIDGKINILNADKIDHSSQKHPRTLLGQKKDGTFILAVVQGRTTNSIGVNAKESAEIMFKLGCYNAVNLDGGGSSEMIVNDQIKNSPTDGCERKIGSAIIVYNKKNQVKYTLIKKNDKGQYVIELQNKLNKHGYSLIVDGDFGNKTETAVLDFQKKSGLVVDGIVGDKTWTALNK